MRKRAILLIYGQGGHRTQMKRLHDHLKPGLARRGLEVAGICETGSKLDDIYSLSQPAVRDKHNRLKLLLTLPLSLVYSAALVARLVIRYRFVGVISTGPGIAVVPSVLVKLLGARIIFLESWSRFETPSVSGKVMYRIADRFYIQNRKLKQHFPKALYGGLL